MKRSSSNSALILGTLLLLACGQGKQVNNGQAPRQDKERGAGAGTPREAPTHSAPDQDRIDSLKQEKQRDKR